MMKALKKRAIRPVRRYLLPDEVRTDGLLEAMGYLQAYADHEEKIALPAGKPIFILSAGWRSGSTLLQRLVTSDASTLIWGEPFGDWAPVGRMSAMVAAFRPDSRHFEYSIDETSGDLVDTFIANLNPGMEALHASHRGFLDKLLAEPAHQRGYARWGCKWVRLSGHHAAYLKWLYPDARFVFLVRHPLEAYRSYKEWLNWYTVRPTFAVNNVWKFMAHWNFLASSFVKSELNNVMVVRYEDLIDQPLPVTEQLQHHLSVKVNRSVLDRKVGGSKGKPRSLSPVETWACRVMTGSTCAELGYDPKGGTLSLESGHEWREEAVQARPR